MRTLAACLTVITMLFVVGCTGPEWPRDRRVTMDEWMLNDYQDQMVDGGIVAAHTIYPYHFVANGSTFNELGQRDLAVLAHHYRKNPGHLNVRQNGASDELYQARVEAVVKSLTDAGVDTDRVTIDDGMPGGGGMASDFVVVILDVKRDAPLYPERTPSGTVLSSQFE